MDTDAQKALALRSAVSRVSKTDDFIVWQEKLVQPYLEKLFTQITTCNVATEEGKNLAIVGIIEYQAIKKVVVDAFRMNEAELTQLLQQLENG